MSWADAVILTSFDEIRVAAGLTLADAQVDHRLSIDTQMMQSNQEKSYKGLSFHYILFFPPNLFPFF